MKTQSIVLKQCLPLAYTLLLLAALLTGCHDPVFYDKPSDASCMKVLVGQKLILEKGVIDHIWTIEASEFTAFSIERIVKNADGTATANVKFELTSGAKVLRVQGTFVYRFHKADGYVEFLSFKPTRLLKLGGWN